MTPDERRKQHIINGSRRKRIAKGSGTSVEEVNRLLKQFVQMQKMLKELGGAGAGGGAQGACGKRWRCSRGAAWGPEGLEDGARRPRGEGVTW